MATLFTLIVLESFTSFCLTVSSRLIFFPSSSFVTVEFSNVAPLSPDTHPLRTTSPKVNKEIINNNFVFVFKLII